MNFENKDGSGKIKIAVDAGDCFTFIKPLSFCWYDNRGSVGKYLCALPYSPEYRDEIHRSITSNLNTDFSQNTEGLYQLLLPLFKLFPAGNYSLNFYNAEDRELFIYQSSGGELAKTYIGDWELYFGNLTIAGEENERIKEHQRFLAANTITKEFYPSDILEYTTFNFYSGADTFFLATQPKEKIDEERVKHFEREISAGARPFAIIHNCFFPGSKPGESDIAATQTIASDYFVLDGHHKLLAYKNLKLFPPIACLTFLPKSKTEIMLDMNELQEYLHSWQFAHVKENSD